MDNYSKQENLRLLKAKIRAMEKANFKSLIVFGGAGTEAMDTVAETLKEEGRVKNKNWFLIEGKVTPFGLYQILFKHRKGHVVVFEDVDSIWAHQRVVDMLKSTLDSHDELTTGWLSQRTRDVSMMSREEKEAYNEKVDQEIRESSDGRIGIKVPSEFFFGGRAIFMSNLPIEKFPDTIKIRSLGIDMTRKR